MTTDESSRPLESATLPGPDGDLTIYGAPDDYIFKRITSTGGFYEGDLLDLLARLPLKDGIVVDAGANIGNHTLFFAGVMARDVYAFEPVPTNVEALERSIATSGLDQRVQVVPTGLWSEEANLGLEQRIPDNAGSFATFTDDSGPIQATTLDAALPPDVSVALIKIDTEGAEPAVLRGATNILARCRPVVVTEAHTAAHYDEIAELLVPLEYRPVDIGGASDNFVFAAPASFRHEIQPEDILALGTRLSVRRLQRTVDRRLDGVNRHVTTSTEPIRADTRRLLDQAAADSRTLDIVAASSQNVERLVAQTEAQQAGLANAIARQQRALARLESELRRVRSEATVASIERDLWRRSYESLATSRGVRAVDNLMRAVGRNRDVSPSARAQWVETRKRKAVAQSGPSVFETKSAPVVTTPDRVRVGIASIPSRAEGLKRVVDSLYPQVDELHVYLNGYTKVPDFLRGDGRVHAHLGTDLGDRGKFVFVDGFEGYYLTADDDIHYPRFYVEHLIDGIERYHREAVVGWHGSVIRGDFSDYYTSSSRRVFTFRSSRPEDTPVHILGTGCAAFHTSTIDVRITDFPRPNMADVWFALQGQKQRIPFVVLAHGRGWATPITLPKDKSISEESIARSGNTRLDVRAQTNKVVRRAMPWKLHEPRKPALVRENFRVLIVGRTDQDRWKKGGILKSTHMTADMLRTFGVHVELVDIETGGDAPLHESDAQVAIVYPGDPQRPDFASCVDKVESLLARRIPTLVNLSFNGDPARTEYIASEVRRLRSTYGPFAHALVFSDQLHDDAGGALGDLAIAIPKSIEPPAGYSASFHDSRGVFLGDIGKLLDSSIIGSPPVDDWIAAVRDALPGEPLFAVAQYKPRVPRDLGLEVLPFLKRNQLGARLAKFRVMVNLTTRVTFDMLPIEVAALGVPVLYRPVPHSLSEYLGLSAMEVATPEALKTALAAVYSDPAVWRSVSRSGAARSESVDHRSLAAQLYLRLLQVASGHGQ